MWSFYLSFVIASSIAIWISNSRPSPSSRGLSNPKFSWHNSLQKSHHSHTTKRPADSKTIEGCIPRKALNISRHVGVRVVTPTILTVQSIQDTNLPHKSCTADKISSVDLLVSSTRNTAPSTLSQSTNVREALWESICHIIWRHYKNKNHPKIIYHRLDCQNFISHQNTVLYIFRFQCKYSCIKSVHYPCK